MRFKRVYFLLVLFLPATAFSSPLDSLFAPDSASTATDKPAEKKGGSPLDSLFADEGRAKTPPSGIDSLFAPETTSPSKGGAPTLNDLFGSGGGSEKPKPPPKKEKKPKKIALNERQQRQKNIADLRLEHQRNRLESDAILSRRESPPTHFFPLPPRLATSLNRLKGEKGFARDPENPKARVVHAVTLVAESKFAEAYPFFYGVDLSLFSGSELFAFAHCQKNLGRSHSSLELYQRAIQLDPELTAPALNNMANVYFQQGKVETALATIRQFLALEPGDYPARVLEGVLLLVLEKYRQGIEILNQCHHHQPGDPTPLLHLALAYWKQGHWNSALHTYRQLQKIDSSRAGEIHSLLFPSVGDPSFHNPRK